MSSNEKHASYQQRMLRVLVYIQEHLDEAISLEQLADVAFFSPYHFHRIFRGMVGESVKAHVRRIRLERAALRLKSGDQRVTQIAFEAGYESHEAFTRAFSAMFGASPSAFRSAHQHQPTTAAPTNVHYAIDGTIASFEPACTKGETMDVNVVDLPKMRVAFVRHVGPYNECGKAWERLMGWAGMRGYLTQGPQPLGISHDDPAITPPDKLRYDACIPVGDDVQGEGDIGIQTIGDGTYAVTQHVGPYEKLSDTYATLCGEWIPKQGYELRSSPALEFYRNSPCDTAPENLITDIHMPIEK